MGPLGSDDGDLLSKQAATVPANTRANTRWTTLWRWLNTAAIWVRRSIARVSNPKHEALMRELQLVAQFRTPHRPVTRRVYLPPPLAEAVGVHYKKLLPRNTHCCAAVAPFTAETT